MAITGVSTPATIVFVLPRTPLLPLDPGEAVEVVLRDDIVKAVAESTDHFAILTGCISLSPGVTYGRCNLKNTIDILVAFITTRAGLATGSRSR